MEPTKFQHYVCWNTERIPDVINTEALSIDRANFMATHAPISHIHYSQKERALPDITEQVLLDELCSHAAQDRHAFMVLQGIPGTGKSNLIGWLKERFATINKERMGNDEVLLVERANCTLRGTLQQIINSTVFKDSRFADHLDKLKAASSQLSESGLDDTVLHSIRLAVKEVKQLPNEEPLHNRIEAGLGEFLEEPTIGKYLKEPGGPIERIRRYLADGRRVGAEENETPDFLPSDFELSTEVRSKVREHGYQKAIALAEALAQKVALRESLAKHLNNRMSFVVGNTTSLSEESLKRIFLDLRRELRKDGKNLVLFIEDITAFTGVDAGLIDVLITQHTGEGNREFCRVISIIGVTDYYFEEKFPDNVKERVTHLLSLNAEAADGVTRESHMLQDPQAIADISARYLNALRVSAEEIDAWYRTGGDPDQLPNACNRCPFKAQCHSAFGAVITNQDPLNSDYVGLYPFNARSLSTMYNSVVDSSHTPRALLRHVLEPILQKHAERIASGNFPPAPNEIASKIKAPTLRHPAQYRTISNQAGSEEKRVESLVTYWGDGTVYATVVNGERYVGEVREAVFSAFGIPFIPGEPGAVAEEPPAVAGVDGEDGVSSSGNGASVGTTSPTLPDVPTPPPAVPGSTTTVTTPPGTPPVGTVTNPRVADIMAWRAGGKLQSYNDLSAALSNILRAYIDWEANGITPQQANERTLPRRLVVEDQAGATRAADYFSFPRSDQMRDVLLAITDIAQAGNQLQGPILGSHLTILGTWLAEIEHDLVEFVRRPSKGATSDKSLTELLTFDCLGLAALGGDLERSQKKPQQLFLALVASCTKASSWDDARNKQSMRSSKWQNLLKGLNTPSNRVKECRQNFIRAINCVQGDFVQAGASTSSSPEDLDVKYVNAPLVLDVLASIEQSNWKATGQVSALPETADLSWVAASNIYRMLQKEMPIAFTEELAAWKANYALLLELKGTASSHQVFEAIQGCVSDLYHAGQAHSFKPLDTYTASGLDEIVKRLGQALEAPDGYSRIGQLSEGAMLHMSSGDYAIYLGNFLKTTDNLISALTLDISSLKSSGDTDRLLAAVQRGYGQLVQLLDA